MATIKEQQKQVAAFQTAFRGRPNLPVAITQRLFPTSAPVKGPVWIAQDDIHVAGEDGVRDSLFAAIKSAAVEPIVLPLPTETPALDVHVEWVGQRPGVARDAQPPPELSESDIYQKLRSDMRNDLTILFVHGGALYAGSSASSRATTTKLARLSKGRVLSVDYRLAPQSQFPAQTLDLLLVYLALLYPPPRSMHMPISPTKIVLAGESSGGGLVLSLVSYILHLRRMQNTENPTVPFGGRDVQLPMPAGATMLSAELDRSLSLPSWMANAGIDFLQSIQPANAATQPPDEVWPSSPPRHDVYCHASGYLHPICNPCVATNWQGAPPLWFAYGEERCLDGGKLVASVAASQGVAVKFWEYRGLPHIFGIVLPHFKQSQNCMEEWATVCTELAQGKAYATGATIVSSVEQPGDSYLKSDVKDLLGISREQAMVMIRSTASARPLYTGKKEARPSL